MTDVNAAGLPDICAHCVQTKTCDTPDASKCEALPGTCKGGKCSYAVRMKDSPCSGVVCTLHEGWRVLVVPLHEGNEGQLCAAALCVQDPVVECPSAIRMMACDD